MLGHLPVKAKLRISSNSHIPTVLTPTPTYEPHKNTPHRQRHTAKMSSSSYLITEPHPTVAQNSYTHSGRGGAGNFFRAPATTPSTGVPTKAAPAPVSNTRFYSGRGGAGNAHASAERRVLSFSEEIARAEVRSKAAFAHVGRGGAGNVVVSNDATSHKSRRDSSSTNGSERSGFWGRLSNIGSHRQ